MALLEELQILFYNKGLTFNRPEILALLGIGGDNPNSIPVLGSTFKVRVGDANYTVIGQDVLIDDIRLIGKTDCVVYAQQLSGELPDEDLDFTNITEGKLTVKNFALVSGYHLTLDTDSGVSQSDGNLQTIADDIAELKMLTLPFRSTLVSPGMAAYLFMRPAIEIPTGFEEVTSLRGMTICGWNPDDASFQTVGDGGGSKTVTLAAGNLPLHRHFTVVDETIETNSFPQDNNRAIGPTRGRIKAWSKGSGGGNESYVDYGASNTVPFKEPTLAPTSGAGALQPNGVSTMSPYRIVIFIRAKQKTA